MTRDAQSATLAAEARADAERALAEDLGAAGDLTGRLIDPEVRAKAEVLTREAAVICGHAWFEAVHAALAADTTIEWQVPEGTAVAAGTVLCRLAGSARALLTAERSALNFLQTLCGTATMARRYVEAVAGLPVRILDTRKTLPGLRAAQKYAVACGGAQNHRMGLYDAILIKENHIAAAGSVGAALQKATALADGCRVQIEVENRDELEQALAAGARHILLDNFTLDALAAAVRINAGRARLEASGGITLNNVRAVAQTGVNDISTGALTRHLHAIDLSMRFV